MTQYISKDALVAKIEQRRDKHFNSGGSPSSEYCYEDDEILSIIDTLEVKEVDLENEINNIWNPRFNLGWDEKSLLSMNHEGFASIAKLPSSVTT